MPTENLRFREVALVFKVAETAAEDDVKKMCRYQYPSMSKALGDFFMNIVAGEFTDSEIMVMLGENGTSGMGQLGGGGLVCDSLKSRLNV